MCRYIFAGFLALFYLAQVIDAMLQYKPVKMPTECKHKTYCTKKNPDYPEDTIENLLKGVEDIWSEIVSNSTIPGKRLGYFKNECKVIPETDPIHVMVDEHDQLRYVVQNKKKFNQIIYIEKCVKEGRLIHAENELSKSEIEHNEFECKQKYLDFKFVVLSLDRTTLETATMKDGVPVCCACVLTKLNTKNKQVN